MPFLPLMFFLIFPLKAMSIWDETLYSFDKKHAVLTVKSSKNEGTEFQEETHMGGAFFLKQIDSSLSVIFRSKDALFYKPFLFEHFPEEWWHLLEPKGCSESLTFFSLKTKTDGKAVLFLKIEEAELCQSINGVHCHASVTRQIEMNLLTGRKKVKEVTKLPFLTISSR